MQQHLHTHTYIHTHGLFTITSLYACSDATSPLHPRTTVTYSHIHSPAAFKCTETPTLLFDLFKGGWVGVGGWAVVHNNKHHSVSAVLVLFDDEAVKHRQTNSS